MNKLITAVAVSSLVLSIGCDPGRVGDYVLPWFIDLDGDGFGDENDFNPVQSLTNPSDATKYSQFNTDCDDADSAIYPGAPEDDILIDKNCDGNIADIRETGPAGGIVFYVDGTGEHGLEAAPADQDDGTGAEWGCWGTDIAGADDIVIGTGAQNTADMLTAACVPESPGNLLAVDLATIYSLNGFNDWFLPSKDELAELYVVYDELRTNNPADPFVVGFASNYYWSSSEYNLGGAWGQYFDTGFHLNGWKQNALRVRAVRAF